jgi:hypothetical protein
MSPEDFYKAVADLRRLVDNDLQVFDGALEDGWYFPRPLSQ